MCMSSHINTVSTFMRLFIYTASGSPTHMVSDSDSELVFEPGEIRKTLSITIIDDQLIFEPHEIFNMLLTVRTGQSVETAVQDGLAQVVVIDDEQGQYVDAHLLRE